MNKTRRGFLRTLLSAIAGGLLSSNAGTTLAAGVAPRREAGNPGRKSSGYRETDHIRAYYDSARF